MIYIKIRPFKPEKDLESMVELVETFRNENSNNAKSHYFPDKYVDTQFYKNHYLSEKNYDVLVAEDNNRIIGYIIGRPKEPNDHNNYWLELVYVSPKNRSKNTDSSKNFQNKHVGKKLLLELIGLASKKGFSRIESNVSRGNDASKRLHENLGFVATAYPDDKNKNFYLMNRKLSYWN